MYGNTISDKTYKVKVVKTEFDFATGKLVIIADFCVGWTPTTIEEPQEDGSTITKNAYSGYCFRERLITDPMSQTEIQQFLENKWNDKYSKFDVAAADLEDINNLVIE